MSTKWYFRPSYLTIQISIFDSMGLGFINVDLHDRTKYIIWNCKNGSGAGQQDIIFVVLFLSLLFLLIPVIQSISEFHPILTCSLRWVSNMQNVLIGLIMHAVVTQYICCMIIKFYFLRGKGSHELSMIYPDQFIFMECEVSRDSQQYRRAIICRARWLSIMYLVFCRGPVLYILLRGNMKLVKQ